MKHIGHQEMDGKIKPEALPIVGLIIPHTIFLAFRAVAGPINFDDGYLMLIHEETEAEKKFDYHRFVYLDKKFHVETCIETIYFLNI